MIDEQGYFNDEFQAFIRERVALNKNRLKACREYAGHEYPDGLYGDMIAMNDKLCKDKGFSLIW